VLGCCLGSVLIVLLSRIPRSSELTLNFDPALGPAAQPLDPVRRQPPDEPVAFRGTVDSRSHGAEAMTPVYMETDQTAGLARAASAGAVAATVATAAAAGRTAAPVAATPPLPATPATPSTPAKLPAPATPATPAAPAVVPAGGGAGVKPAAFLALPSDRPLHLLPPVIVGGTDGSGTRGAVALLLSGGVLMLSDEGSDGGCQCVWAKRP